MFFVGGIPVYQPILGKDVDHVADKTHKLLK